MASAAVYRKSNVTMQITRSTSHRPAGPWQVLALYVFLVAAPLLIAAFSVARERGFAAELAVGTGLVALAMLLLQFISSGRHERVSGGIGIDRTLRFHQLSAWVLIALVLLHPLLLVLPSSMNDLRNEPGQILVRLAMMAEAPFLRSGVLALVLLIVLVALAALRTRIRLRYEIWRATHLVLALVVAAASLHHALAAGQYSSGGLLKVWWVLMAVCALAAAAYAHILKPVLLARAAWRVKSNQADGEGIRELVIEPVNGKGLKYAAGQFIWVDFGRRPTPLGDHPYSLASSPREGPDLRLLIKARGDFSGAAASIAPGTPAYVDGPHGDFFIEGRDVDAIALIAGGIGIAPIAGILRDLAHAGDRRKIALLYGARNLERMAGREAIAAVERSLDLQTEFVLDEPPPDWQGGSGAISPEAVLRTLRGHDPRRCLCLLCGPTGMMLATEQILLRAGVPAINIVYERFDYA